MAGRRREKAIEQTSLYTFMGPTHDIARSPGRRRRGCGSPVPSDTYNCINMYRVIYILYYIIRDLHLILILKKANLLSYGIIIIKTLGCWEMEIEATSLSASFLPF
jgi:hypothetical protein